MFDLICSYDTLKTNPNRMLEFFLTGHLIMHHSFYILYFLYLILAVIVGSQTIITGTFSIVKQCCWVIVKPYFKIGDEQLECETKAGPPELLCWELK
uniref:K+ potassium transporter integral membrane domain-containing protein n=1 Tax=Lactuca sativa TaxID=4236 RepID=A0A9R1WG90_LACSA|nr:hypothetical protein LSAT_V11C200091670 [Lactuca sativa]